VGNAVLQRFEILEVEEDQSEEWNQFVWTNPCGTVFQTYHMLKVYEQSGIPTLLLGVRDRAGFCSGLLAYFVSESEGTLSSLSRRSIVFGGPLYLKNDDLGGLHQLLGEYERRVRGRVLFTEVKNHSFDLSPVRAIMTSIGFQYEPHLNFLLDLTQPAERLWSALTDMRRRTIRQGERAGVSVEEVTHMDEIQRCYRVLEETFERVRLPLAHRPSESLLRNAFSLLRPKGFLHIFLAALEGRAIATLVTLSYKDRVSLWLGGSSRSFQKYRPNDVLHWESMMWAKDHGYKVLDFLGAGTPEKADGVRVYKSEYGAESTEFGVYRLIHSPIRYMIAYRLFPLYRRFFLR